MSRNEADLASVSCLDDPVRGRLYAFVSGRGEPVGRDEAAAAVGIGRALAVYHLDKLVEAGLLTASYRRPPGRGGPGAGRPAKVYARSGGELRAVGIYASGTSESSAVLEGWAAVELCATACGPLA